MKPTAQTDTRRDDRHNGQRRLSAAEGVLVALRHCSLDEAFTDIVQTAKQHNVAPMVLADALVAIAENDGTRDFGDAVVTAVGQAWGTMLGRTVDDPDRQPDREQAQLTPIMVHAPATSPKLTGSRP